MQSPAALPQSAAITEVKGDLARPSGDLAAQARHSFQSTLADASTSQFDLFYGVLGEDPITLGLEAASAGTVRGVNASLALVGTRYGTSYSAPFEGLLAEPLAISQRAA